MASMIGQRQLQDETRNIWVSGFGANTIRGLTVWFTMFLVKQDLDGIIKLVDFNYLSSSGRLDDISLINQVQTGWTKPKWWLYRGSLNISKKSLPLPWWRHQMEKFSASLAFVRGIQRGPVNSPHKGQWRGALMFSLICARINGWVNNGEAGDLGRHRAHYDVTVMVV